MTQEEKLEEAKRLYETANADQKYVLESLFPELAESEDERIRKWIIGVLSTYEHDRDLRNAAIVWLERQGEQKPAWSEKDDIALGDALWCCKQAASIAKDENDMGNVWYAENWLKSLRPQNRWKPSEGQLECLGYAIDKAEKDWSPLINNRVYLTLKALKEQLEKIQ